MFRNKFYSILFSSLTSIAGLAALDEFEKKTEIGRMSVPSESGYKLIILYSDGSREFQGVGQQQTVQSQANASSGWSGFSDHADPRSSDPVERRAAEANLYFGDCS